jgi:transposase
MFKNAVPAIDGATFKAANSRDRNFTRGKLKRRMEQITESIGRCLEALDVADLQESPGAAGKAARLTDKIAALRASLAEHGCVIWRRSEPGIDEDRAEGRPSSAS